MIISDARELGPSGHINGSCVRHEIARNRASDQPHSVALVGKRVSLDHDAGSHSLLALWTASHQYQIGPKSVHSTQQHDTSSHQNPFKSSDHRFMWLAATRPMRGRGAGWLPVLIPLWAVCLRCFARQVDQGCQMTWPFASCR
ncbi:hypothetical protein GGI35DRAFT_451600 [Trichoderma velutinum]